MKSGSAAGRGARGRETLLAVAIMTALAQTAAAQRAEQQGGAPASSDELDEIVTVGRLRSAQFDVVQERLEQEVVADFLGVEQIARTGDSSVSLALRRMPGISLVNNEFIYVRGLGERYSSALLNGAHVPSPDLTRNVLPLDIFPTSIVEGLAVHKGYTPDLPASFGGGNVNILTRGIPNEPFFSVEVASGWNSESSGKGLTYSGGGDDSWGTDDGTRALPAPIRAAIQEYQGNITASGILRGLDRDGTTHSFAEAQEINRQLATSLYRDVDIRSRSLGPDAGLEVALGNRWYPDDADRWQLGALGLVSYDTDWRNRERTLRSANVPNDQFSEVLRTTRQVSLTGVVNLGLDFTDDHSISTSTLFLLNTEDDASISLRHTTNFLFRDGRRLRDYIIRFEERELESHQIRGQHVIGADTAELLPFLDRAWLSGLTYDWYYSDAKVRTEIPSEIRVAAEDRFDTTTGDLLTTSLRRSNSAVEYRFTELDDDVESYGWSLMKPLHGRNVDVEISGGQDYTRKARQYLQTQINVGTTDAAAAPALAGTPSQALSADNLLDPLYGFALSAGGIGTESYLAGEIIDAAYLKVDAMVRNRWRVAGGLRREQFSRAGLPIDPLDFSMAPGQSRIPPHRLHEVTVLEEDVFPAVAVTYVQPGFWADTFQLRFGASETIVRPDLREISPATFIDPLTEARVTGRPSLRASPITNYDIRGEWFFANRDNFTVSLFYKDIDSPIETVETAGSDDNVALTFVNTESAHLYGVEVEWLKDLAFLGNRLGHWVEGFFLAGNLTMSDSELTVGRAVGLNLTSDKRRMNQHSKAVTNLQLGYDAFNGAHSWTLAYNTYSERLYWAGRGGAVDAYEQPFDSLDFIYSYHPTDRLALKFRLQNLLNDKVEIKQGGVTVLEQKLGTTAKLDLKWDFAAR